MAWLPRKYDHYFFMWIPLFGSFVWTGTLVTLLITWFVTGRPRYITQDGDIAFISDVGADFLKPLFVTGATITGVCFFVSQCIEKWLRHHGRLLPVQRQRALWFGRAAVGTSFVGGSSLILLSVFDTKRFFKWHRVFLGGFVLGVTLSALFSILEYRHLHKHYYEDQKIRTAYLMKGVLASILFVLAVAFAALLVPAHDPAAILEWIVAFLFTMYLWTSAYNLRMAKGTERGQFLHLGGDMDPEPLIRVTNPTFGENDSVWRPSDVETSGRPDTPGSNWASRG